MQFSHAVVLAFVAAVAAQTGTIDGDVAALPACAKKCLDTATLAAGCKSITDYECQCGTAYDKINSQAAPCVASTCEASDLTKTLTLTTEICKLVKAGGASSGGGSDSSSASAAPSTSDKTDTAAPTESGTTSGSGSATESGSPSTDTSAPTTTGAGESPSTTGESAPTTTDGGAGGGGAAPTTTTGGGGAAPTTSDSAAATGSWNLAAVAAGAGAIAAGFL